MKLQHHIECMGCGPENPAGLGLRVSDDGEHVHGTVTFERRHTGASGIAHGGAVTAAFDDLLGHVPTMLRLPAVTATITVDFRSPAMLGHQLTLDAWCARTEGRKLHIHGTMHDGDQLVAEARALFIHVDLSHFAREGAEAPDDWIVAP